jgi:hypothetical protein
MINESTLESTFLLCVSRYYYLYFCFPKLSFLLVTNTHAITGLYSYCIFNLVENYNFSFFSAKTH